MDNDFIVRRCEKADYREFLDMLNVAFGYSAESCWFQQNINNCTPYPEQAPDALIGRHVVAVERGSGKIMGGVGAYPLELIVSADEPDGKKCVLPSVGIGQVSCLPQYRNRGVMSATLNTALRDAAGEGAVVGFLGGDRYRYGRFGFDYGGGTLTLHFSYGRLKTAVGASRAVGLETRAAGADDIAELNDMYETLPSYIKRDADYWRMQFGRGRYVWSIGRGDAGNAFIAYDGANAETVAEIGGEADTALALLAKHMADNGLGGAKVSLPLAPGRGESLYETLWRASSHAAASPCGMSLFAILDPDKTLAALQPAAVRAVGCRDFADCAAACAGGPSGADKLSVARIMLGSPGYPAMKTARPASAPPQRRLAVWISEADGV